MLTGKYDVREAAAALPEIEPLGTEVELEDTNDSDTEADLAELDAIPEEAEA